MALWCARLFLTSFCLPLTSCCGWHVKKKHFDLTKVHSPLNTPSPPASNLTSLYLCLFGKKEIFSRCSPFSELVKLDMDTKSSSTVKACTKERERVYKRKGWYEINIKKGDGWKICSLADNISPLFFLHSSQLWEWQCQLTLLVFGQRVKVWGNPGLSEWYPVKDLKWTSLNQNHWTQKAIVFERTV